MFIQLVMKLILPTRLKISL